MEEHAGDKPVALTVVYKAMTSDIINSYSFGKSDNSLDRKDYREQYFEDVQNAFEAAHLLCHVGWLGPLTQALPLAITTRMMPAMGAMVEMQQVSSISHVEIPDFHHLPSSRSGPNK